MTARGVSSLNQMSQIIEINLSYFSATTQTVSALVHINLDQRLAALAVAGVSVPTALVRLAAQVCVHLTLQRGLQEPLGQLLQQPRPSATAWVNRVR